MALISMRQLLDYAAEHQFGVPAFNVNNLEQTRAIMEAAAHCDAPVIMQASAVRGSMRCPVSAGDDGCGSDRISGCAHCGSPRPWNVSLRVSAIHTAGIYLGDDGWVVGYGRQDPMDYDYNAQVTAQVVEMSHACGCRLRANWARLVRDRRGGEEDGVGAAGS